MDKGQNFQRNNRQTMGDQTKHNQVDKPNFPDYIKDGKINIELFDYAEKITEYWQKKSITLKKNQLRNIYNEAKNIEKIYKKDKSKLNETMVRLKLLKAKIKYNEYKESSKFPSSIGNEIILWIDKIKKENFDTEFRAFCNLFESVVGYFYQYAKK